MKRAGTGTFCVPNDTYRFSALNNLFVICFCMVSPCARMCVCVHARVHENACKANNTVVHRCHSLGFMKKSDAEGYVE